MAVLAVVTEFVTNYKSKIVLYILITLVLGGILSIIGGLMYATYPMSRRTYPFQVFLYTASLNRPVKYCGGSLVTTTYILTAAHCLTNTTQVTIILGNDDIKSNTQSRIQLESNSFVIHEDYNAHSRDNDIALIKLPNKVDLNEDVNVVRLPRTVEDYGGKASVVLGWAVNDSDLAINDVLLTKDAIIVNNSLCNLLEEMDEKKMCSLGHETPCSGDAGGPLLVHGTTQVGVVSFGEEDCPKNTTTVSTRIDRYVDWIASHSDIVIGNTTGNL